MSPQASLQFKRRAMGCKVAVDLPGISFCGWEHSSPQPSPSPEGARPLSRRRGRGGQRRAHPNRELDLNPPELGAIPPSPLKNGHHDTLNENKGEGKINEIYSLPQAGPKGQQGEAS